MQEENGLSGEQREMENALRSLSPTRSELNPIAAAFEAGGMVHRRQVRVLSGITTLSLCIAIASFMWPSASPSHDRIVIAPVSESRTVIVASPSASSLISLEQDVRSQGIDGLPATAIPKVDLNNPL